MILTLRSGKTARYGREWPQAQSDQTPKISSRLAWAVADECSADSEDSAPRLILTV